MKTKTKILLLLTLGLAVSALFSMILVDRKLQPTIDTNNDGRPDEWFSFDAWGRLVSVQKDRNKDGTVDYKENYQDGLLKSLYVDMDKNGVFEVMAEYNEDEVISQFHRDRDQNGSYERLIHYDPQTRLPIRWEQDTDGDGVYDAFGDQGEKWVIPDILK